MNVRRTLKRILPKTMRSVVRNTYESLVDYSADYLDRLLGRQDPLTPPRRLMRNVGGDFKGVGETFVRYLVELCQLQPHEAVLDVGCGCGRMAVPLTRYLNEEGSYEGFDTDARAIQWCTDHITPKHPRFHFRVSDVRNRRYNPRGPHQASEYKFPYGDKTFDCVFLTSVLTHLLPEGMENYLSEVSRVMNDGGRCLITLFLLNGESLSFIKNGESGLDFNHDRGCYRVADPNVPEQAVAYDEAFVLKLYRKYGLRIQEPIRYGSWCGRSRSFDYQDIIVASKSPC
jgi:SAM-dependent methyltransferase